MAMKMASKFGGYQPLTSPEMILQVPARQKLGNEKYLGWLGFIGDYIGIIINHYKDPY